MVKRYLKINFGVTETEDQSYVNGLGNAFALGKGFYAPPFFINTATEVFANIAAAAGGTLVKDTGFGFDIEANNPCPESTNIDARKLKFTFTDGSTTEIPIRDTVDVVGRAQNIKDNFLATTTGIDVLCVDLIGEEIDNLNDELGVSFDVNAVETTAGNGKGYAGKVAYEDDANQDTIISVKTTSVSADTVPPIFAGAWTPCVGDFLDDRFTCGGSDIVKKHRRLIVQYQVQSEQQTGENVPEQRELPIVSRDTAAASTCGFLVAQNNAVFCIGFQGESRRFIHKLLT